MKSTLAFISSLTLSFLTSAQSQAGVDIEIDPATFVFDGNSLHLRYTHESAPQWRWGIGTYSLEIPDLLVDINKKNRDQQWDVKINRAIGVFTEYYFNPSQIGWFVGAQVSTQDFVIKKPQLSNTEFTNGLLMLNLGYKWEFKNSQFYLLPWMGLGYTKTIDKDTERKAAGFDLDPITSFMTLHLGYKF